MIKILGLVGKKHSGKDSVCNEMLRLSANLKTIYPVFRIAFADELKEEVAAIFGTTVDHINRGKNDDTIRNALQFHGTRRRKEDINYWINLVNTKINSYKETVLPGKSCILVITDVRHLNEAEYIKNLGGILIRIKRTETDSQIDNHESETNIDKIKYDNLITNEWNINRLAKMTEDIMNQYNLLA